MDHTVLAEGREERLFNGVLLRGGLARRGHDGVRRIGKMKYLSAMWAGPPGGDGLEPGCEGRQWGVEKEMPERNPAGDTYIENVGFFISRIETCFLHGRWSISRKR